MSALPPGTAMQPVTLVVHADWSSSPHKRWMARAARREKGRYHIASPQQVGELRTLIPRLVAEIGTGGCALLGFDFPIGLPLRYAEQVGVRDFLGLLPLLGRGDWSDFYSVAERAEQVSLRRPFYPLRPGRKGQARLEHLLEGLGLATLGDLRRRCELPQVARRAAAPLFWTVGGQQVGKAAICGWSEVLGPALGSGDDVAIWPFSGPLFRLLQRGRVVIAETYPAEVYGHLGVTFAHRKVKSGKRVQADRRSNAQALLNWARAAKVSFSPGLQAELVDGFGSSADGEDRFDATVGLLGMLNVLLKRRSTGEPQDDAICKIEGWILGQAAYS